MSKACVCLVELLNEVALYVISSQIAQQVDDITRKVGYTFTATMSELFIENTRLAVDGSTLLLDGTTKMS